MKRIIIDTNALMAITEFKLDLFTELEKSCDFPYQLYILEGTIKELKKIKAEQSGRYKLAAKLALALVQAKKIKIINCKGNVDTILVKKSQQGYVILTQDMVLKKKLTTPYLTIRQKKKIMIVKS